MNLQEGENQQPAEREPWKDSANDSTQTFQTNHKETFV